MKCYQAHDKEVGTFIVPGCYPVAERHDIGFCVCQPETFSFSQFEKKEYNVKLAEAKDKIRSLNAHIATLKKENERLVELLQTPQP